VPFFLHFEIHHEERGGRGGGGEEEEEEVVVVEKEENPKIRYLNTWISKKNRFLEKFARYLVDKPCCLLDDELFMCM
jgi:hypothetical protein